MTDRGRVFVVGNGPGDLRLTTPMAAEAISAADFVCGYEPYVNQISQLISSDSEVFTNGMTGEMERVQTALKKASEGLNVALVCGGDASLYALASLTYELSTEHDDIEVIPGVTSALSASARLGAPISDDIVIISMSDLLTPWDIITKRIKAVNDGDFVCAIYNPRSKKRLTQLPYAVDEFINARGDLACGWVKHSTRENEKSHVTTLTKLDMEDLDMSTVLIVGSRKTYIKNGKLVSPRGYTDKYGE